MKRRWYDHDPTLSMAVSLLQNASLRDQRQTVQYIFTLLEQEHLFEEYARKIGNPLTLKFFFSPDKRRHLDRETWRLLEILKLMPKAIQLEMALNIINYTYVLEAGMALEEEELSSFQNFADGRLF